MVQARLMVASTVPHAERRPLPDWRHRMDVLPHSACPWYLEMFMLCGELKEGMTEYECDSAGSRPAAEPELDDPVLPHAATKPSGCGGESVSYASPVRQRGRRRHVIGRDDPAASPQPESSRNRRVSPPRDLRSDPGQGGKTQSK